jgi:hypothetical protein
VNRILYESSLKSSEANSETHMRTIVGLYKVYYMDLGTDRIARAVSVRVYACMSSQRCVCMCVYWFCTRRARLLASIGDIVCLRRSMVV